MSEPLKDLCTNPEIITLKTSEPLVDLYHNPLAAILKQTPIFAGPSIHLQDRRSVEDLADLSLEGVNVRIRGLENDLQKCIEQVQKCTDALRVIMFKLSL